MLVAPPEDVERKSNTYEDLEVPGERSVSPGYHYSKLDDEVFATDVQHVASAMNEKSGYRRIAHLMVLAITVAVVLIAVGFFTGYYIPKPTDNDRQLTETLTGKVAPAVAAALTHMVSPDGTTCMDSTDCWIEYDFLHDDMWYNCTGKRYTRWLTEYRVYVGVKHCGNDKYHMFLSSRLEDMFLNLGTSQGNGAHLCELLGGSQEGSAGILPHDIKISANGYSRSGWSEAIFHVTELGNRDSPHDTSEHKYIPWINCPGLKIPGSSRVEILNDANYPPSKRECYVTTAGVVAEDRFQVTQDTGLSTPVVYFCYTRDHKDHEVHAIALNERWGFTSKTTQINIMLGTGREYHPIRLLLAKGSMLSRSAWSITTDVEIIDILQVQYNSYGTRNNINITVRGNTSDPVITNINKISFGYGEDSRTGWKDYMENHYGFITSFVGVDEAASITLYTGI